MILRHLILMMAASFVAALGIAISIFKILNSL